MTKETLDKANELEEQIGKYEVIAYITSFPYQKFRLFKKKAYIHVVNISYSVAPRGYEYVHCCCVLYNTVD